MDSFTTKITEWKFGAFAADGHPERWNYNLKEEEDRCVPFRLHPIRLCFEIGSIRTPLLPPFPCVPCGNRIFPQYFGFVRTLRG